MRNGRDRCWMESTYQLLTQSQPFACWISMDPSLYSHVMHSSLITLEMMMLFVKIKTEKCIPRIVDEANLTFFMAMVFAVLFGFASRLPFYSGTCSGGRRRLKVGCNMILWLFHHLCWSVNLRGHHYWTCGPISNVTKMWHENRFRKWTLLCKEKGFCEENSGPWIWMVISELARSAYDCDDMVPNG